MDKILNLQSSPHVRDNISTRSIMLDVIIALLPTSIWGVLRYGKNAFLVILVSIICAVASETIFNKIIKKPNTVNDLSAVVTAMILALNLSPNIPLHIPAIGSIFAIVVVKMLFGGLGQNFMNPALTARCFLLISFAGPVNKYYETMKELNLFGELDAVSSATPLAKLAAGETVELWDLFLGNIPGAIGEVSKICLLLGAIYLLAKGVIHFRIPLTYIGSFLIFMIIFSGKASNMNYILGELLGGGLIFGAFYMANDYVTSPVTHKGEYIYATFLGVMTGLFRLYGKSGECVSFIILLGNILVPFFESISIPRPFGKEGK